MHLLMTSCGSYGPALHNDILANNGLHILRRSYKILEDTGAEKFIQ